MQISNSKLLIPLRRSCEAQIWDFASFHALSFFMLFRFSLLSLFYHSANDREFVHNYWGPCTYITPYISLKPYLAILSLQDHHKLVISDSRFWRMFRILCSLSYLFIKGQILLPFVLDFLFLHYLFRFKCLFLNVIAFVSFFTFLCKIYINCISKCQYLSIYK